MEQFIRDDEHTNHIVSFYSSYSSNVYATLCCIGVCCNSPHWEERGCASMSYSEQFREHIEYTFNGFCKTVLYHEALNVYRDLQRKQRHEISLEYIVAETTFDLSATDEYFRAAYKPTEFQVQGQTIVLDDERLAIALSKLSARRQEIVLLFYFCGYRDMAISKLYGYCRSTTNYQRQAALKQLKKELEHEKR